MKESEMNRIICNTWEKESATYVCLFHNKPTFEFCLGEIPYKKKEITADTTIAIATF